MASSVRVAVVGLLSLLVAGCAADARSSAAPGASSPNVAWETQRSAGGDVTVEATWAGPDGGTVFDVKLDTHSVDLDGLDLSDAVLRNDRAEVLKARPWAAPLGGHHRAGILTFDGDSAALVADARWIELVVVGVGGTPERILRWELDP